MFRQNIFFEMAKIFRCYYQFSGNKLPKFLHRKTSAVENRFQTDLNLMGVFSFGHFGCQL